MLQVDKLSTLTQITFSPLPCSKRDWIRAKPQEYDCSDWKMPGSEGNHGHCPVTLCVEIVLDFAKGMTCR